jgi:Icc-related predicted phosphoesterase
MRIRILSDLHEEYAPKLGALEFDPIDVDVTILAGDIANGVEAIKVATMPAFARGQVIVVPGNHEFYGGQIDLVLAQMRAAAAATSNVHLLDQNSLTIQGVRFLGATLWTDYALHGADQIEAAIQAASPRMVDYRLIRACSGELFNATESISLHKQARQWLEQELVAGARAQPGAPYTSAEKVVVVTHHAPHPLSVHARFAGNAVNPAFVSDLSELMGVAQLWVHGHAHNGFDYQVAGTRVVANPAGYRKALTTQTRVTGSTSAPASHQHWLFENALFNPNFVVEI